MITVELTDQETRAVLTAITTYKHDFTDDYQTMRMRRAQQKLLIAVHQQQRNQT